MSISSISGSASVWQPSSRQTKSPAEAAALSGGSTLSPGMSADSPHDAIKVDLPNGMSIGVVSFGGLGLDSATLKTIEDFVQRLASHETSGAARPADESSGADDTSGPVGLDKIHVDLPNGISFEVRHFSGGQPTNSAAIMKQLTDAAGELADAFATYSPYTRATAAYAARQVTSSGSGVQMDTHS